jgi:YfiH family protein
VRTATIPALAAVPGLVHGFEQRLEPASRESRDEGRRRVAAALHRDGQLLRLKQVHGARVIAAPWQGTPEADAATCEASGVLLGIETADCLPVLIVDPRRRALAAAHAGWRGTAAAVARRAVESLVASGSRPSDLIVALGPGIGPCCYEVGEDVKTAFGPEYDAAFSKAAGGKLHLDVRRANVMQLHQAGIPTEQIHHVADCTYCRADLYHSFRREGTGSGRMLNFIGWSAAEEAAPPSS